MNPDSLLIHGLTHGHHDIVILLLGYHEIDVDQRCLILASRSGFHEIVKFLITVPGIDANTKVE